MPVRAHPAPGKHAQLCLVSVYMPFKHMHVLAGTEERSVAAHQAIAHPAILRQDTEKGKADSDDAGAIASDAQPALAVAQHAQQRGQLEGPDGQEHDQPEDSEQQQPAAARKGMPAGPDSIEQADAKAEGEMSDAEQAGRLPDVAESGIAAGTSPSRCMHLDTLPAFCVSSVPSDSAAAPEASPAGKGTPVYPADPAEEQPLGSDLHGARGLDESAKQSGMQGSRATMNSDDEHVDVQSTEELLETLPLEQLSVEHVGFPPVGADATVDGTASHALYVAVHEQQSTGQFCVPDTADMPCGLQEWAKTLHALLLRHARTEQAT